MTRLQAQMWSSRESCPRRARSMTLVGGMGTVFGPMVGAAIIITMQNYLAGFGEWVLVIQGVIFVITVLLFRRGVVGEVAALGSRLVRQREGFAGASGPARAMQ